MPSVNALLQDILTATPGGAGSGFTKTYWFATASTEADISHAGGATNTYLTNNGAGAKTSAYNPQSKSILWNASTNSYDFTSLKVGDIAEISGIVSIDNLAAQGVDIFISMSEGTSSAHEHKVKHEYYKTAATGTGIAFAYSVYMHDADALAGGARIRFASAQAASIDVDYFTAKVTEV